MFVHRPPPVLRIAALQGAPARQIQSLLAGFAARVKAGGMRVAGVVEIAGECTQGTCGKLALHDLASGTVIQISQDLGPGSTACNLDPAGLADACAAVEHAIAAGADVVVLSKFGKQEAVRGGLVDAFAAAVAAGLPIVTAVSPALDAEWRAFAGGEATFLQASCAALDAWWETLGRARSLEAVDRVLASHLAF